VTHKIAFHKPFSEKGGDRCHSAPFFRRFRFVRCRIIIALLAIGFLLGLSDRNAPGQTTVTPTALTQSAVTQSTLTRIGMPLLTQSPDEAWIESLIRQDLPDIAQTACKTRIAFLLPDSDAFAQWMMLLLASESAVGVNAVDWSNPGPQLDALLQSLSETAKPSNGTPREPWIQWKLLWSRRWIQQRSLAAFLAVPNRELARQWTLASIRTAIDGVESLDKIVSQLKPRKLNASQRRKPGDPSPEITSAQILDLRGDLELLKADLLYQRSQCYPPASDDRIAAATEMFSAIDRAMQRLPGDWSHRPLLLIARTTAQLQLGQNKDALRDLQQLWDELERVTKPHPEQGAWKISIAANAARACRELQQWDTAQQWLDRVGGWTISPELAMENFALEIQRNTDLKPETVLAQKRDLGSRFGSYWEQRADALLVSNPLFRPSENPGSNSASMAALEIFRIEVRQLLAAKKWDAAIEKLGQAELAASKQSNVAEAFGFAMQVAAALESKGDHVLAADEFHRAAISYPDQAKAPAASLMSAWLIRTPDPKTDVEAQQWQRANYRQRLIDTTLQWPASDAATQATQWVEQEMLGRDDLPALLNLWHERMKAHPNPEPLVQTAASRLLLAHLLTQEDWLEPPFAESSKLDSPRNALRDSLLRSASKGTTDSLKPWLDSLSSKPNWSTISLRDGLPLTPWTPDVSAVADNGTRDPVDRFTLLWHACDRAADAYWHGPETERASANQLLAKLLPQLVESIPAKTSVPEKETKGMSLELGPRIRERILRSIEYYRICLGVSTSSDNAVIGELKTRQAKEKKSLWWLYRTARAMQTLEPHRDSAIALYRQMATGVPAGSDVWLEARARTVQTLRARGDNTNANQLRDLVFATYPSAAAEWRSRFDSR